MIDAEKMIYTCRHCKYFSRDSFHHLFCIYEMPARDITIEEIKKGCKNFKLLVWGTCDNCRKGNQIDCCELFDRPFPKKRTCDSWWEVEEGEKEVSKLIPKKEESKNAE